jgi:hypothetical protein
VQIAVDPRDQRLIGMTADNRLWQQHHDRIPGAFAWREIAGPGGA